MKMRVSRSRFASSYSRGFTLIELLTVIAIIGILAAIIIPTIGKVRESARATQSLSNLRQIGMGLALYLQDNKNMLPAGQSVDNVAGGTTPVYWSRSALNRSSIAHFETFRSGLLSMRCAPGKVDKRAAHFEVLL
jgi:prepilin-type N-terminal cleavage/methylation domain-containing protein